MAMLELLVAVPEHGSLSAAANAVGMTQPNASRAMARLERSLGFKLVVRNPSGSRLTADGAVVVDWARSVLECADRLLMATDALRVGRTSHITVAASMTVAECLMPAWLAELRRIHPDLKVRLIVQNSLEVFDSVKNANCDVGFVESAEHRDDLRSIAIARDRLVVVVSPEHQWSNRRNPVTASELAMTPLVVRESGSGTRTTLEAALAGQRPVSPTLELNSNAAVRVSVAAGAGPAVLSELAVASWLATHELIVVPTSGIELGRTMRAVWSRDGSLHAAAEDLVRIARKSLELSHG